MGKTETPLATLFSPNLFSAFLVLLFYLLAISMRKSQKKRRCHSKRKQRNRLQFETMEPRRLLAADIPSFSGDAGLYQVFSNHGQVGQVDLETKTFEVAQFSAGTKINAVGFRPADNFAYGVVVQANMIARIGSTGEIEILGQVEGLPTDRGTYFVGDFGNDDLLYLRNSKDLSVLYGVNVDTLTVDKTISTSEKLNNIYDIAFNHVDETFYASRRGAQNTLISIDMNGQVNTVGSNGLGKLTFGAMYADADGAVFGGANQTGDVYRFDTQTGAATLVGKGPTSGSNDGFSNATKVLELAPIANDDAFIIDGLSTTNGSLFADTGNGSDLDGNDDEFFVSAVNGNAANVGQQFSLESGSTLIVTAEGQFAYKPTSDHVFLEIGQSVTEQFEYTITDDSGRSAAATVSVTVQGVMEADELGKVRVKGLSSFGGSNYAWLTDVGDLNGDGFADGAVGLPSAYRGKGVTFVVFGTSEGIKQDFDVNDLRWFNGNDGSLGSIYYGVNSNDLSGYSFSGAGDVNGDGVDDLLIGAKDADANGIVNSGQTYVVFGSKTGFGRAEINLSSLSSSAGGDGASGFIVNGIAAHDLSSSVVASIGDINADGIDDFAIGAQNADADLGRKNSGQTYVIYGSNSGFDAELNLSELAHQDVQAGFVVNGVSKHDLSGGFVTGGRDLNGDGIDDMLVAAANADANQLVDSGQSYVIYGSRDGFDSEVELADFLVENGSFENRGFVIHGDQKKMQSGSFVDMVADMNGDGIAELSYGNGNFNSNGSGVILGGSESFGSEVFLADYDSSFILLDNFETALDVDDRSWDTLTYSATLYSSNGTRVTIWGDPHVEIEANGQVERFDIGYGAGSLTLVGGAVVQWDTFEPNDPRFPLGPPLRVFSVQAAQGHNDISVDTADGVDSVGNLTSLTNAQLRDFADQLRLLAGDAAKPLGSGY